MQIGPNFLGLQPLTMFSTIRYPWLFKNTLSPGHKINFFLFWQIPKMLWNILYWKQPLWLRVAQSLGSNPPQWAPGPLCIIFVSVASLWLTIFFPLSFLFFFLFPEDFAQLCNVARSVAGLQERPGYEYAPNQEGHNDGIYSPEPEPHYTHLGLEYGTLDTSLSNREPNAEFGDGTSWQAPQRHPAQTQPHFLPSENGKC